MSDFTASGRKLFGKPTLLQDWDSEAEEGAAAYWELFLDLLLVAAASSLADQFKEDQHFANFTLYFFILVNGWFLYNHHVASRFQDASLAHSMVLFVYIIGFGVCIVNVGHPAHFCVGGLIQRLSILVMVAHVAVHVPRARSFCVAFGSLTTVAMMGLLVALIFSVRNGSDSDGSHNSVAWYGLWMTALIELLGEVFLVLHLQGSHLVPVNIEQSKERLGALELVMLGETALSVTITYRELTVGHEGEEGGEGEAQHDDATEDTTNEKSQTRYYWVLGLSFLLIFMMCLLYFHMLPTPNNHAFRRSRWHGTLFLVANKFLALALLAVGTSVKLIVEAVLMGEDDQKDSFLYRLLGYGVGAALLVLLVLRYLHFGNRKVLYFAGGKALRQGEHADLDRVVLAWWITVGMAWLLPLVGILGGWTTRDPFSSLALHAVLLFALCAVESFYSHFLEEAVAERSGGADCDGADGGGAVATIAAESSSAGERQPLTLLGTVAEQ